MGWWIGSGHSRAQDQTGRALHERTRTNDHLDRAPHPQGQEPQSQQTHDQQPHGEQPQGQQPHGKHVDTPPAQAQHTQRPDSPTHQAGAPNSPGAADSAPPTPHTPPAPEAPGGRAWITETPLNRLTSFAIIAGVVTGVMVAAINWAVIFTERAVYGTDHIATLGPGEIVAPERLAITLVIVGVVTAIAWFCLDRFGRPTVSVPGAMKGEHMPVPETVASAFLQVMSVAAGAPVGRENAPRLIGGLAAAGMCRTLHLDAPTRRILVASAAGAGLAASFHLPLAGALFTLELLLLEFTTRTVVAAMVCSATAVATTSLFVHHHPIYRAVVLTERPEVLLAAIVVGAIAGSAGHFFGRAARKVAAHRARGAQVLWQMPLAFAVVAALAYIIPGVSGNGRYAAQILLFDEMTVGAMLVLGVARAFVTLLCFRTGAVGGTLTPAFALGALVGAMIGTALHPVFPTLPLGAFALMGAAAFLSTTMAAPMFGMLAAVEFTDMPAQGYLAMFITVIAAAVATRAWAVLIDKEEHRKILVPTHWSKSA